MSDPQSPQAGPTHSGNPKADAKAAKAYAKASRPWYKKKRYWLLGFVLLIVVIAVATSGGSDEETPTATDSTSEENANGNEEPANEEPAEEEPEPQAMPVKAGVILQDFEDNEAAADGKYSGKTLRITGVVAKVDTELMDDSEYVVQIGTGGDFEFLTVNCDDQSADDVAPLRKGDDITVVGDFEDGGDLGVELRNCTIK